MLSLWRRLPVILRATITGLAVTAAGTLPWALLAAWNQRVFVQLALGHPAHDPLSLAVLEIPQRLRLATNDGGGPPTSLRANRLSGDLWGMSLLAGLVGLGALLPLLGVMSRLVRLPAESQGIHTPPQMPFLTVFLLLVMASVVAGVVEEAGFRGYMQGPIERRHGPLVAIVLNGALFGVVHYTHHPASVVAMLPYYLAVAAVYGGLAYATNSILPAVVLHAGGDVFSLTRLWMTGQPEWQVPPSLRR